MPDKEPEIDPVKVEIDLINELIGENIIIIIHQNGMSIMMDEEIKDRPDEQLAMFSRMYVAARPSMILWLVINVEIYLLLLAESISCYFKRWFKKDE